MKATNPHNSFALQRQLMIQKKLQWDLMDDIKWEMGIDQTKPLVPVDFTAMGLHELSGEQQVVLSQYLGLVINATISEMEDALPRLKFHGWERILDSYPANPEIRELGELFFEEEQKHAAAFKKYLQLFSQTVGLEPDFLTKFMPRTYGSRFQKIITKNAQAGGHAFWWIVALTEEVSIKIFHEIDTIKDECDPLFYHLHRLHLEEESRHANYAYLMLEIIRSRPQNFKRMYAKRMDYLFSQLVATPWILGELTKIFDAENYDPKSEFFDTLKSCLPHLRKVPKLKLATQMFSSVPYISWFLNPNWRNFCKNMADKHGAIMPRLPNLRIHL